MGKRGRATVVVLGDIGRSPRMQYHALSLASQVNQCLHAFFLHFDTFICCDFTIFYSFFTHALKLWCIFIYGVRNDGSLVCMSHAKETSIASVR